MNPDDVVFHDEPEGTRPASCKRDLLDVRRCQYVGLSPSLRPLIHCNLRLILWDAPIQSMISRCK